MPGMESTAATSGEHPNSGLLRTCREAALRTREELDKLLSSKIPGYTSEDTSRVVFGSLARGEWTSGSDLDWTYLIDGGANPDHLLIAQRIQQVLEENEATFPPPGPTGTFGKMAFSHDIIHQIGGQNDTNKNTTQRILLLLESCAIGKRTDAYERVILGVINRYLDGRQPPVNCRLKELSGSSLSPERHRAILENDGGRFCE
jgi:predicted nucleotidyltransferase